MLVELHLENLGVIERADLVLGPGLTALTGETGAGKTMIVEALDLVLGGRADPVIVRHGEAEARVDARFVVPDGTTEREVVLSRVVPASGRSRAYVDGRPVTVTELAATAGDLVDLHGQHSHQRLLTPASQRDALDAFGGIDLTPLHAARAEVATIDAELAALGGDERARARELDLARFQLAELDAAEVTDATEDDTLRDDEDALADVVDHKAAGVAAHEALAGDGGARDAIASAAGALGHRGPYRAAAERLLGVLADLDDVIAGVRDQAEALEEDPERLAALRERRQLLRDLRRKYGDDLADVIAFHHEVRTRVDELESHDVRAAELDAARAAATARVAERAADVRRARDRAAEPMAAEITSRLRGLALPNARLEVTVRSDEPTGSAAADAGDRVEFLLAANPGSPPLPLAKVASGGELARTMLALRLAMVEHEHQAAPPTLVFDEVDAGIGGSAAVTVGRALADVGRAYQVLVVTHLPQVAAAADHQFMVEKHVVGEVTSTTVTPLASGSRVREIARMLSGDDGGPAAERHARELLSR